MPERTHPKRIGSYRILELRGEGPWSPAYLAEQQRLVLRKRVVGRWRTVVVAMGLVAVGACWEDSPIMFVGDQILCDVVDQDLLVPGGPPPDGIRAINLPVMVEPEAPEAEYVSDSDRILGVVVNGEARAYPHRTLWRHEIVNDQIGDVWVSVTFGPLTGSGLAFDPHISGERLDLGSSGLLFANNLVLYDRTSLKGYGPQLAAVGLCQGYAGQRLALVRVQEMSWARWKQLHPDTKVVSGTGFPLDDLIYPFGSYDQVGDERLLFPMPVDNTRPIKERVLAIRVGLEGGRGYPFGELAEMGDFVAINETVDGVPTVVFFEARDGQAAVAFDARVGGQDLTFDPDPGGFWTDRETGSTWTFDGVAVAGTHSGERLLGLTDAYTLFWFAWRQFQPDGTTFLN